MLSNDGMYCKYILDLSIPVSSISGMMHHVGSCSLALNAEEGNTSDNNEFANRYLLAEVCTCPKTAQQAAV